MGDVQGLEGLGHLEDGSGQTGLLGWGAAPRGDGLSFSLEAGFGSAGPGDGEEDGVRGLRWTGRPGHPGLGDCLEEVPTGVVGSEDEALVVTGSGSWVGFLGEEDPWRFFFGAEAEPFLGNVGVQAGEAAYDRHV